MKRATIYNCSPFYSVSHILFYLHINNYIFFYKVIALSNRKLNSLQLAIIAALFTVIGDFIALIAAISAYNEEQTPFT